MGEFSLFFLRVEIVIEMKMEIMGVDYLLMCEGRRIRVSRRRGGLGGLDGGERCLLGGRGL
jgi:hypothetical protein